MLRVTLLPESPAQRKSELPPRPPASFLRASRSVCERGAPLVLVRRRQWEPRLKAPFLAQDEAFKLRLSKELQDKSCASGCRPSDPVLALVHACVRSHLGLCALSLFVPPALP